MIVIEGVLLCFFNICCCILHFHIWESRTRTLQNFQSQLSTKAEPPALESPTEMRDSVGFSKENCPLKYWIDSLPFSGGVVDIHFYTQH